MTTRDDAVLLDQRGSALWLRLNRPATMNGLNQELLDGLHRGLDRAAADDDIRCVVIGAVGRAFGIVSIGLSTGGMIGPMLFGWIMDSGMPRWVFGITAVFMMLTVALALIGDRRSLGRRCTMRISPGWSGGSTACGVRGSLGSPQWRSARSHWPA